ncbi:holin [Lactococcus formosensis]|uniref:holin n=1 Tax=Lactococcus formosensis TaxID=1281486 RepID=UPI00326769B3
MFTNKTFWKDTLERAIKTCAQSLVAVGLSGATGVLDVDWVNALSVSLLATLVSVLTSIGSGTVGDQSASVINLNKENK